MTKPSICILGGDMRFITVGKEFSDSGFKVNICGFDKARSLPHDLVSKYDFASAIKNSNVIILPLPYSKDRINVSAPLSNKLIPLDLVKECGADKIFFGGMTSGESFGTLSFDYYENEELKIFNAIPTAEGALSIALNESTETLHGCRTAVLGFGRIGRVLGMMLKSLNSEVTVLHRSNNDDAWCSAFGISSSNLRDIKETLKDKKIIFNTIPKIILTKEILEILPRDVIIIDLASSPGGVDYDEGKRQGLNIIKALSLPGRLSPVTAGKAIKKCISNIIYDNKLFEGEIS